MELRISERNTNKHSQIAQLRAERTDLKNPERLFDRPSCIALHKVELVLTGRLGIRVRGQHLAGQRVRTVTYNKVPRCEDGVRLAGDALEQPRGLKHSAIAA